ncbi:hypothetical protein FQZ97_1163670 [compost metagenome]
MASIENAVVPDFLIHEPGTMNHNHAILEVKSSQATALGIRKDLATLDQFCVRVGYQRAIYLFYGGGVDLDLVRKLAAERPVQAYIEIWLHSEPGAEADLIDVVGPY